MINGVIIKKLISFHDDRGFFREIFRFSEEFNDVSVGQISHSLVKEGVIKAWHGHTEQSQWNYVVNGKLNVCLIDSRPNSSTYRELVELIIGDDHEPVAYYFPAGILHGYKCIKGPLQIIYVTSGVYDLSDEIRISPEEYDDLYNWEK